MKVDGVSFTPEWVQGFKDENEFADSPSNAHLYPQLRTEEAKKAKLKEVFFIFNPEKKISNDTLRIGRKSLKARSGKDGAEGPANDAAQDGRTEPQADGTGDNIEGGADKLPGEN